MIYFKAFGLWLSDRLIAYGDRDKDYTSFKECLNLLRALAIEAEIVEGRK
jgi:hypothetical protein